MINKERENLFDLFASNSKTELDNSQIKNINRAVTRFGNEEFPRGVKYGSIAVASFMSAMILFAAGMFYASH